MIVVKEKLFSIQIIALLCLMCFTGGLHAQTAMVNVSNRHKTSLNGD